MHPRLEAIKSAKFRPVKNQKLFMQNTYNK